MSSAPRVDKPRTAQRGKPKPVIARSPATKQSPCSKYKRTIVRHAAHVGHSNKDGGRTTGAEMASQAAKKTVASTGSACVTFGVRELARALHLPQLAAVRAPASWREEKRQQADALHMGRHAYLRRFSFSPFHGPASSTVRTREDSPFVCSDSEKSGY